jgi:hypothetical protein
MHPSLQQPPPQQQPQQVPQVPQDVLMKLLELQQQQVRPVKFSIRWMDVLWPESMERPELVFKI